ncbi:hypothetical protein UCRPC4_g03677 [Phaeomoniella chlamydospora]|uniref:Uncharacterized protein n=1 Tax=Phaeomoniella chlamydospora TaxID=158046 RepID=A0A0G2EG61_PHACM|nr:hypothetical protein UCRPC4_g03677 [Phaeomoniella chlamydospora]
MSKVGYLGSQNEGKAAEIEQLNKKITDLDSINSELTSAPENLQNQIIELEAREEILETRVKDLRTRNSTLTAHLHQVERQESRLRSSLQEAERTNLEDEVALEAMSAAVGGLEGWMDSFISEAQREASTAATRPKTRNEKMLDPKSRQSEISPYYTQPQRPTVRGRGRFRGLYDPQSQSLSPLSPPATPSSTQRPIGQQSPSHDWTVLNHTDTPESTRGSTTTSISRFHRPQHLQLPSPQILEFEEGIRSWVKGFRDVEESIRSRLRSRSGGTARNELQQEPGRIGQEELPETETESDVFDAGDGSVNDDSDIDEFGEFEHVPDG